MTTLTATARTVATAARRDRAVLAVLLLGVFMTTLDTTIVNVGAPTLQRDLGLSAGMLQLVVAGYSVVLAALLVTGARLGDDHGHRRLFLLGLAGFTVSSLACGLAGGPAVLVAGRAVQGAAAAAMVPQVSTLIQLRFTGAARARAYGLQASVIALGAVVGQVVGGALVSADIAGTSWRPVFLVNVPIGAVLLVAGARVLPVTRGAARRRLDLVGVDLLAATLLLLVVPVVFGPQAHWAPWTWACLTASVPTAVAFVLHVRRLRRRGGDPVVDLTLLRRPAVRLGLAAVSVTMVAYGGFLFALTLHLQEGLHDSPLRAGLVFAPYALGFAVAGLAAPRLPGRAAAALLPVGLVVLAAAYVGIGAAADGGRWPAAGQAVLLAVAGVGFGGAFSPVINGIVAHVPLANAHDASGLVTTTVQVCFAVGIAVLGSVFSAHAHTPAPAITGHAFAVCGYVCAGLALLAVPAVRRLLVTPAPVAGS